MAKRPEITVLNGELKGKSFAIPEGGLKLGRASSNDVHIPDEELSRNHCLFEQEGEDAIRVIDLASANGTFVNGEQLGASPRTLKPGDRIEAGATLIGVGVDDGAQPTVFAPKQPQGTVNLGLGPAEESAAKAEPAPVTKRQKLVNLLWAGSATFLVVAIFVLLTGNFNFGSSAKTAAAAKAAPAPVKEEPVTLLYERIDMSTNKVERYCATLEDGMLKLEYAAQLADGTGKQSFFREGEAAPQTIDGLVKLLDSPGWLEAKSRADAKPDEVNRLQSWRLSAVKNGKVRDVVFVNAARPPAFQEVCGQLEILVNNDLQTTPMLRSPAECLAESARNEKLGEDLYAKRSLKDSNLWEAIKCFRNATSVLDGLQECFEEQSRLQDRVEELEAELSRRYEELNSRATLADTQQDLENALIAYREIRALIPDESDPRCSDAVLHLRDIETRMDALTKGSRK